MRIIRFEIRRFRDNVAGLLVVIAKTISRDLMNLAAHVRSK
jgi:hypothetical protein